MSIPTRQLERWTKYETAAIDSAKETHKHVRKNIENSSNLNKHDIEFDTLLQGSYANDTIIRSSSDVDILVRLQDPFKADIDELSDSEVDCFHQRGHYQTRDNYDYSAFRTDVINELKDTYGQAAVNEGNKAIEVESSALPLDADVVPVQEYRYYNQYSGYDNDRDYIEGIIFWPRNGSKIRNYPEQHMSNATTKHQNTSNRYKSTVRMFKNARNYMDDKGIFDKSNAPSYFIECLLWNVPNSLIDTNKLRTRYVEVVNHLSNDSFDNYRQQHDLLDLFGFSGTKWSTSDASAFVDGLTELWETW
jgi:hypothetical protein